MANLPDLDTSEIGVIAFWNAHDHRANPNSGAVIDPTDVLGVLSSYTLYDNGVDGAISYGPRADINVRVKNDGWIIAWIDRTNTYQLNAGYDSFTAKGYYDLAYDWKYPYEEGKSSNPLTANTNTLIEVISHLFNQLSNKADFTFSKTDVGTYCYEFTDISSITIAEQYTKEVADLYLRFTVTAETTLRYLAAIGLLSLTAQNRTFYVKYSDGTSIVEHQYGVTPYLRYGSMDLVDKVPRDTQDYLRLFSEYEQLGIRAAIVGMWG